MRTLFFAFAALTLAACSSSSGTDTAASSGETSSSGGGGGSGAGEDLDMTAADFGCILDFPQVRQFRMTNKLGHQDEALAVADSASGGEYPVGTLIQLIPTEAMVKRRAGFSEDTHDWEFFSLAVSASETTIKARGTSDVTNLFGGNCFDCHSKAEPQWDLVCEQTHGCDPLPFTAEQIKNVQDGDPRCP